MMRLHPMIAAAALATSLTTACNTTEEPPRYVEAQEQALGESANAFNYGGSLGADLANYQERLGFFGLNWLRLRPDLFGLETMEGPIPPHAPLSFEISFIEAARWQREHVFQTECECEPPPKACTGPADCAPGGTCDPMSGMCSYPFVPYTCCEIGEVDGVVQCTGPVLTCDDLDALTKPAERYSLLNRGPGAINAELYVPQGPSSGLEVAQMTVQAGLFSPSTSAAAVARATTTVVPEECAPQPDSCDPGVCTDPATGETSCEPGGDANPDCVGTCVGGDRAGQGCTLNTPLPPECAPDELPEVALFSVVFGSVTAPPYPIADAIHFSLADDEDNVTNYLATNVWDPAGVGQVRAVIDGACEDLLVLFGPRNPAPAEPFPGDTYGVSFDASRFAPGCYRYMVQMESGEGFDYTYPNYGTLGMQIGDDGNVVPNDESCPVWAPERGDASCLPDADECNDGDTRNCYTGRAGTQDKGVCEGGLESCEGGRWSGFCADEVRPALEDTCGDELDDNCNGEVDEGCPAVEPEPEPEPDAGTAEPDAGTPDAGPAQPGGGSEDGGCCATVHRPQPRTPTLLLIGLGLLGLVGWRRRR